jgi:hypothetical protein
LQNRQLSSFNTTLVWPAVEPDGSGDSVVAAFARWAAQERVAEAAGMRSKERSLRDQAAGEATWSGLMVELAESQGEVELNLGSRRVVGRVVGMGRDFCVVEQRGRRTVLIPIERIVAVWKERPTTGSRYPALDLSFEAALAGLADERSPVCLHVARGNQISGELIGCGADLVTLRTEPTARRTVHVRTSHIEVCELR